MHIRDEALAHGKPPADFASTVRNQILCSHEGCMPAATDPQLADREMLERALGGDRRAMNALYKALCPVIRVRALRILSRYRKDPRHPDLCREVDDLVQSAWERLFAHNARDLRKWTPEHGLGLRGYVGLVAGRDVIDMLHGSRAPISPFDEALDGHPSGAPGPEIELGSREMLLQVVRALREELSPKGAAIFELLILEDQPVAHVCNVLNMKQDAVFQWRSRIAQRAREIAKRLSAESDVPRNSSAPPGVPDHAREPES